MAKLVCGNRRSDRWVTVSGRGWFRDVDRFATVMGNGHIRGNSYVIHIKYIIKNMVIGRLEIVLISLCVLVKFEWEVVFI